MRKLTRPGQETKWVAALKNDASVTITLPVNASAFELSGVMGPNNGVVNMLLDPPAPHGPNETLSLPTNRPWPIFSSFLTLPLHPAVRYSLKIWTEAATAGEGVFLNSTLIFPYDDECVHPRLPLANLSPRAYEWANLWQDKPSTTGSVSPAFTSRVGLDPADASKSEKPSTTGPIVGGVVGNIRLPPC